MACVDGRCESGRHYGCGCAGCPRCERFEDQVAELLDTFRHTHVALYDMERLLDKCATCGLDIRHAIHRANRGPGEGD